MQQLHLTNVKSKHFGWLPSKHVLEHLGMKICSYLKTVRCIAFEVRLISTVKILLKWKCMNLGLTEVE